MNRSAPSSNEKTSKIDFHILLVFKLMPKHSFVKYHFTSTSNKNLFQMILMNNLTGGTWI
jgi:hypothetical protein